MNTEGMPPPTFGEWLDEQLRERRWSRPQLGRAIGYSQAAVQAWIRGVRQPEERACRLIADALGVEQDEVLRRAGREAPPAVVDVANGPNEQSTQGLLTGSQGVSDDTVTQFLSRIESEVERIAAGLRRAGLLPVEVEVVDDAVRVPVVGRVPADSLRWAAMEEDTDVELTRAEVGHARAPFGLIATGDCLRSIGIWSGDVVICDRALGREPRDRQLVVVRVNTEVTLKRWCVTESGIELRDGDEQVVHRLQAGEDIEIIGFYLTYKPVAER